MPSKRTREDESCEDQLVEKRPRSETEENRPRSETEVKRERSASPAPWDSPTSSSPSSPDSSGEPPIDTEDREKKSALRRLFGRISSVDLNEQQRAEAIDDDDEEEFWLRVGWIPVDVHPEQLGFVLCAQETVRFLRLRGMPGDHPVLTRLRAHFVRGIHELGQA